MFTSDWLAVSSPQALRFFFERLKDVSEESGAPEGELLYNASLLAHFASTSASSTGGGRSSVPPKRMSAGTVCAISSSSVDRPNARNIALSSSASGPM